jgi:uncharacterized membrane protein YozB (DUF420 family)
MRKVFSNTENRRKTRLVILDALVVLCVFFLSYAMRIVFIDNRPRETISAQYEALFREIAHR